MDFKLNFNILQKDSFNINLTHGLVLNIDSIKIFNFQLDRNKLGLPKTDKYMTVSQLSARIIGR